MVSSASPSAVYSPSLGMGLAQILCKAYVHGGRCPKAASASWLVAPHATDCSLQAYDVAKVQAVLLQLMDEAPEIMLFLKNIECIEVCRLPCTARNAGSVLALESQPPACSHTDPARNKRRAWQEAPMHPGLVTASRAWSAAKLVEAWDAWLTFGQTQYPLPFLHLGCAWLTASGTWLTIKLFALPGSQLSWLRHPV